MTLFAIYQSPAGIETVPRAVPERFSWFACLLPPVFAVAHGLWLELLVYVLKVLVLALLAPFIGPAATFWLYVLLALWIGFASPGLGSAKLHRAGWQHRADLVAPAADSAALDWLERS